MAIIVVSDMHLGYEEKGTRISNDDLFLEFLKYIAARNDVTVLVVLGDFIDMWRRDVSGLFLEYHDIVQQLVNIGKKIGTENLIFVAGNHDYHLLHLNGSDYPFNFQKEWNTTIGEYHFAFKHGHEFDFEQNELMMEALCHNLSDQAGQERSAIYDFFGHFVSDIKNLFSHKGGREEYIKHIMLPPEKRHNVNIQPNSNPLIYPKQIIQSSFNFVETEAYKYLKKVDKLVFGHTHRPFVSSDGRIANSGSWVSDSVFYNTYLEIDDSGQIKMFQYRTAQTMMEIPDKISYSPHI